MRLLIATTNAAKARELSQMLGDAGIDWSDLSSHQDLGDIEETGRTFRANACLKASEYARKTGLWTLADDSGLEVDALGGRPGVFSARWASMHDAGAGDAANNELLLKQLAAETGAIAGARPSARFVCVLALSDPRGRIGLSVRDTIEGHIIRQPRGRNGFGYDPLFLVPELGKTTAELTDEQKHQISHRGRAMRRMTPVLRAILNEQKAE